MLVNVGCTAIGIEVDLIKNKENPFRYILGVDTPYSPEIISHALTMVPLTQHPRLAQPFLDFSGIALSHYDILDRRNLAPSLGFTAIFGELSKSVIWGDYSGAH